MATQKVSLTLDEDLLTAAREQVGHRGLSQYINTALRHHVQRERLTALLDELAKEHDPIDPRVMQEVRDAWPDLVEDHRRSA